MARAIPWNRWPRRRLAVLGAALALIVSACGGSAGGGATGGSQANAGQPQRGGSMTFLVSGPLATWDRGLDPASAGSAPAQFEDAIFGQLFRLDAKGNIQPVLATGYSFGNGNKDVTVTLRQGVKFQDGTPFDASAVAWNWQRDLQTPCPCNPSTSWPKLAPEGITTPDDHTVVVHMSQPYGAFIPALMTNSPNHIASPTAAQKMGDQFKIKPVGAGPFSVVSNVVSSQLVLQRYDGYFKQGQPYLDKLTFKTIGGDQPAYQAVQAGQAQAAGLATPQIIQQASQNGSLQVTKIPGVAPATIQLNTAIPPFNDKRAREAIYYATDASAINSHVMGGMFTLTQSFTGPNGLFYTPKVPGYRTHDVAKAKQLVQQLGGLKVNLISGNDTVSNLELQALQSQWGEAGIQTTIFPFPDLARTIQEFQTKKWQAALQLVGAYDPAVGAALPFRFLSGFVYSGVNDPTLDQMMSQAAASTDKNQRTQGYQKIAKYISDNAYAPFLFAQTTAGAAVKGVTIPGITSQMPFPGGFSEPNWDEAWMTKA